MIRVGIAPLIRLAGGDPARVAVLSRALHRDLSGRRQWLHDREGGGALGADGARRLGLGVLVLCSIVLAFLVRAQAATQPWFAAMILCAGQAGAVLLLTARDAVPLLLADEDRRLMGWWPVSERELLLARCGLLLRSVLQASLAVAGLPLLVLAVHGRTPPLDALSALIGLCWHALALTALLAIGLQGLARLWGRHRARRAVELAGVLILLAMTSRLGGGERLIGAVLPDASGAGWAQLAVPTAWFAAWAAGWPPSPAPLAGVALSIAGSIALVAGGVRLLGGESRGEAAAPAGDDRRPGRDRIGPFARWLGRRLPGREGRVVSLLLGAHLRGDWRLGGQLLTLPCLMLAMLWLHGERFLGAPDGDLLWRASAAANLPLFCGLYGMSLVMSLSFSNEAAAAWMLRGARIDGWRLLALQRRLVVLLAAATFLVPGLILVHLQARPSWLALAAAAALALVACLTGAAFVQWVRPSAPFSRAWRRDEQGTGRRVLWLLAGVWPLHVAWQRLVLEKQAWGWPVSLAAMVLLLAVSLGLLRRRVARIGVYGLGPQR